MCVRVGVRLQVWHGAFRKMKELVTSFSRLTLSMSVFSVQLLSDLVKPEDGPGRKTPAVRALDAVSGSAVDQFDPTLRATFQALDNVQRGVTSLAFGLLWPLRGAAPERERSTFKAV